MIRSSKIVILVFSLISLVSCIKEPPILKEKTEFDELGWNRFKYLEYKPKITDISTAYSFTLKLEVTNKYEHNFFKIQLSKEAGGESYVKIFTIPIKDHQGDFIEKPMAGIYNVNAILSRQIYFSSPGTYLITIEQLMPKFDTKGIKSAEFIIEKREK